MANRQEIVCTYIYENYVHPLRSIISSNGIRIRMCIMASNSDTKTSDGTARSIPSRISLPSFLNVS